MYAIVVTIVLVLSSYSEASLGDCDSSGTITFNCSGAGISTIPTFRDVPSYYQILDFSNNYISNISRLDFALNNNITTLLLNHNQIRTIEPEAFGLMAHLLNLDLSGNILDGHNLKERQFDDLRHLINLTLERNPLQIIRKETFTTFELFALKHLDLSHCAISEIEENAIEMSFLEYLDLSWNELDTFHKYYFKLTALKTLDLSHNRFTVIDQLPYMPELKIWILDNNRINNFTVGVAILHLADKSEHLYLRNNAIERFTTESFPWSLETLQKIHLDNNPLDCDCKMKWAAKDAIIKGKNFTITCETPSNHKGKNLLTIPPEDLKCGIPLGKMLLVIGMSLIVVLCFMGLVFLIVKRKKRKRAKTPSGQQTQKKTGNGSDYTAVYTKEEDEVRVHISDRTELLSDNVEEIDELDVTQD